MNILQSEVLRCRKESHGIRKERGEMDGNSQELY